MHLALLLCLSATPAAQEPWVPLPLPAVCRPSSAVEGPYEVLDANHLRAFGDQLEPPADPEVPVAVSLVLQLVDEELRRRGSDARLELAGDLLLVQGPAQAVDVVREVLAGLEALEATLEVEVEASLVRPDADPESWRARGRSGERMALGERVAIGFLGDQDVNVATDSGVAEPETHHALTGHTVHLTASRLGDGRVLIEGTLDLVELLELEDFDPGTPDLGLVQLPRLATTQVRFAGIDRATVSLAGLPDSAGSATLVVVARARPAGAAAGPWRVFDLSALAARPPRLGRVDLGRNGVQPLRVPASEEGGLDPGALAALVGEDVLAAAAPLWGGRLMFVPAGSPAAARADALLPGLEARLVPGTVSLTQGGLRAEVPVVDGRAARLVVGIEQRRVTDVASSLAPSTWMAQLEVERTFEGLVLTGTPRAGGFEGALRETSGALLETVPEERAGLAAVQRLERRRRAGPVALRPSAAQASVLLAATPQRPAVLGRFRRP